MNTSFMVFFLNFFTSYNDIILLRRTFSAELFYKYIDKEMFYTFIKDILLIIISSLFFITTINIIEMHCAVKSYMTTLIIFFLYFIL